MSILIPIIGELSPQPVYCIRVGPDEVRARYHFEWHPIEQKVYVIHKNPADGVPKEGFSIAEHVSDHGAAIRAGLCWVRGYLQHGKDIQETRGPSHA